MPKRDTWRLSYHGGCVMYFGLHDMREIELQTATYYLDLSADDYPSDLAGTHLTRTGKPLTKLPTRAIAHDVVVLVRPTATKEVAIKALQRVIDSIERDGLLLGGLEELWSDEGGRLWRD